MTTSEKITIEVHQVENEGHQQQEGQQQPHQRGFTSFTSICFTANYLLGTGFLTIPWAFQQGGILLSTITMIFVVIICDITKNYVLTAMAYAEALSSTSNENNTHISDSSNSSSDEEEEPFIRIKDARYGSLEISSNERPNNKVLGEAHPEIESTSSETELQKLLVKDRKFEYAELCYMFLGKIGEQSYVLIVAIAIYLQLWGYAAVFGLGMAQYLKLGGGGGDDGNNESFDHDYKIYVLLFGAFVVPVSCLELKDQVAFQILLSFCRFFVIYLMIQTAFTASVHSDDVYFTDLDPERDVGIKMVDFSGFYKMFSVMVFTAMFHNGIPVLSQPVEDRSKLSSNFRYGIVLVEIACWMLGVVVASYFGSSIEQSANLNWDTFVGGTGKPVNTGTGDEVAWINVALWAKLVAAFIVLFPPMNVMSAYPLNAIVLGNNLVTGFCGSSAESNIFIKILFRVVASAPSILGAYYVKELGIITTYSGILSILTVLSFPSLLYLKSKNEMAKKFSWVPPTHYDGFGSSNMGAYSVFGLSIIAAFYILIKLTLLPE